MRNEACLLSLPEEDQFRWLHRFYLVLDRIAEQHRVRRGGAVVGFAPVSGWVVVVVEGGEREGGGGVAQGTCSSK